jgi:exopolyphosphatase/guanosine-5'-triphosphate,3'-diphosphate pyrophosphatase
MGPKRGAPARLGQPARGRPRQDSGRVAVIDIGSNTIRLVVYDARAGLPIPLFNEKSQCELIRGLTRTGRLNPAGVERAFTSLARFVGLAEAMGAGRLDLVATAAVREAADGPAFAARIGERFGRRVDVVSGAEEAKLAALGLLGGIPDADGLLADLGGGSLDLVGLRGGRFGATATLPLGHLRLPEAAQGSSARAMDIVVDHLAGQPWLAGTRGRTLYAIGGSWRATARVLIDQTGHPLHVVDNFTIDAHTAEDLAGVIAGLSRSSIDRIVGVAAKRAESLPYAALVLHALIKAARPRSLCFSAWSMREGRLLRGLGRRRRDALIAGCRGLAERSGRAGIGGDEVHRWTSPLFPEETAARARLRLAACLLSDIGWAEHPDYRAEHAFHRVLRVPFAGLTHPERVWMALAVLVRYNGDPRSPLAGPLLKLLLESEAAAAETLGRALRLAYTLSGSAPGLLGHTALQVDGGRLLLRIGGRSELFAGEAVERRLGALARGMGLQARLAP